MANGVKHLVVLEHPEDLSRRENGAAPASIWQWPSVQTLAAGDGVLCGALYQCDFGADYLKPTRLLTNISLAKTMLHLGLPEFDAQGTYLKPLPKRDWQGPSLVGKDVGTFRTQG